MTLAVSLSHFSDISFSNWKWANQRISEKGNSKYHSGCVLGFTKRNIELHRINKYL